MSKVCTALKRVFKRRKVKVVLFVLLAIVASIIIFQLYSHNYAENKIVTSPNDQTAASSEWILSILKLDISVPIVLNVSGTDKDKYFAALQGGVAQMEGTALPGEGNTVIFGHSSFYKDDPGQYKKIFSTLDQLKTGDEIKILNNDKDLTYTVQESKLLKPDDVGIVKPTINKQLTLLTCWPPGTIEKRLVVIADLK